LRHGERPHFDVVNRKSERGSVNETKPALFSAARNDRFAGDACAERFAVAAARATVSGPVQATKSMQATKNASSTGA
jgi:hypothetical protein